jgi:NADP-dependent 3-hydroxy acid dehydrogenase YdfG
VNIDGSRTLVAGATGELGSALSRTLHGEGAELAPVGRDAGRLTALGEELDASTARLDVRDPKPGSATTRRPRLPSRPISRRCGANAAAMVLP